MSGFRTNVPVRFSDIDMFGHVNSPVYLTYCEINRVAMFEKLRQEAGPDLMNRGFVVAETHIRYLKPVTLEDGSVKVSCTVGRLGRSSIQLSYRMEVAGEAVAEAELAVVLVSGDSSRPMSEVEREWFTAYQPVAS